ncbi:MAG: hypothetical protein ACREJ5_02705 [Geminicoccaceae bacterium]
MPHRAGRYLASVAAIGLLLSACAVRHASPEGITIEHDTLQPELAVVDAERHCARYGKKAVLVKTTAEAPSASLFYLSSSLSVFDCVLE